MATSKYKRPIRIFPTVQPQPLDAKSIAREALGVSRECMRVLHARRTREDMVLGQLRSLLEALDLSAVRALAKER